MKRDITLCLASFIAAIYFVSAVLLRDIDPDDYR